VNTATRVYLGIAAAFVYLFIGGLTTVHIRTHHAPPVPRADIIEALNASELEGPCNLPGWDCPIGWEAVGAPIISPAIIWPLYWPYHLPRHLDDIS
jgi:hypothetical protein